MERPKLFDRDLECPPALRKGFADRLRYLANAWEDNYTPYEDVLLYLRWLVRLAEGPSRLVDCFSDGSPVPDDSEMPQP